MPVVAADTLRELATSIFAATGAPADIAGAVADSLVQTSLTGHDSHGVMRVMQYVDMIRNGDLVPAARPVTGQRTGAIARLECGFGFGQIGAQYGAGLASELAHEHGIGCVALENVNHVGRLGEYAEALARAGHVGMVFTSGTVVRVSVAPWGGREPLMSTNPMAWAVPTQSGETPLVLDFATAVVANGKVQVALARGESFPEGMLLDRDGNPTTDPATFYNGGMLQPFGTYKGHGLSLMMELVPGILCGFSPVSSREFRSGNPTLILALAIDAFTDPDHFEQQTRDFLARVKAVSPAEGFDEVLLPGEKEQRSLAERSQSGIPLPQGVWDDLCALAQKCGVTIPAT